MKNKHLSKSKVKEIQRMLNAVLGCSLKIDGIIGHGTNSKIKDFQTIYRLHIDGIYGEKTDDALTYVYLSAKRDISLTKPMFCAFVDAGHWGWDNNGNCKQHGKCAYHEGETLHQGGWFYEGVENRIVAEMVIQKCTKLGIMTKQIYHPRKDTRLEDRAELVKSWLKRGYFGLLFSIHSDAAPSSYSEELKESTTGLSIYTTVGNTFSDQVATIHYKNWQEEFGDEVKYRPQSSKDGDPDREANFAILRKVDIEEFSHLIACNLEEFNFYTSAAGCRWIIANRERRVKVIVKTIQMTKELMEKNLLG